MSQLVILGEWLLEQMNYGRLEELVALCNLSPATVSRMCLLSPMDLAHDQCTQ